MKNVGALLPLTWTYREPVGHLLARALVVRARPLERGRLYLVPCSLRIYRPVSCGIIDSRRTYQNRIRLVSDVRCISVCINNIMRLYQRVYIYQVSRGTIQSLSQSITVA